MSQTSIGEIPQEWGEFLHIPSKVFTDFEEIRKEIVRDTDLKTGHSKGNDSCEKRSSFLVACYL